MLIIGLMKLEDIVCIFLYVIDRIRNCSLMYATYLTEGKQQNSWQNCLLFSGISFSFQR